MKKVFLYAGQGSQKAGMGKDFYEEYESYREFVDSLTDYQEEIKLMHDGPLEDLSKTEHTQPCMAIFAAGVTKLLAEQGILPAAACGLSLGEYGTLYAAGVFSANEYIDLLAFRGNAMMKAAEGIKSSMSAILGMDSAKVSEICEQAQDAGYVTVANYNCPGQAVICGEEDAVAKAEELLKANGAKRCVRLNVSGPFHTRYMKSAGDALAEYFKQVNFKSPAIPVASNVTGRLVQDGEDIRQLLELQVQRSVYLEQDLAALLDAGYTEFVEIGPGNTMAGFLKKTARAKGISVQISSIESTKDFRKVTGNE